MQHHRVEHEETIITSYTPHWVYTMTMEGVEFLNRFNARRGIIEVCTHRKSRSQDIVLPLKSHWSVDLHFHRNLHKLPFAEAVDGSKSINGKHPENPISKYHRASDEKLRFCEQTIYQNELISAVDCSIISSLCLNLIPPLSLEEQTDDGKVLLRRELKITGWRIIIHETPRNQAPAWNAWSCLLAILAMNIKSSPRSTWKLFLGKHFRRKRAEY